MNISQPKHSISFQGIGILLWPLGQLTKKHFPVMFFKPQNKFNFQCSDLLNEKSMPLTHWRAPTGTVRKMNLSAGWRRCLGGRHPVWSNSMLQSVSKLNSIITQLVLLMRADGGGMTVLIEWKCDLYSHKSSHQWLQKHSTTVAWCVPSLLSVLGSC